MAVKKTEIVEDQDLENEIESIEDDELQETAAADSLKPGAAPGDKMSMINSVVGAMSGMDKNTMVDFFNAVQAQFGPGKEFGVGDNSGKNSATIDMKSGAGPKTKDAMPRIAKEDIELVFSGEDLSEETKEKVSTIFEAAVSARVITETVRIQEEFETRLQEEVTAVAEELTTKLDTYLDHVVENWMKENEVAIESTLRNEVMEGFMEGLKGLFTENYIDVPQSKVDVLEALAQKVEALEGSLNETIAENTELKGFILEAQKNELAEEVASDLALTQQEKFFALVEGIEFNGNLETFEKKLKIVKENYFKTDVQSSNIEEETFEGEISESVSVNPTVNRYLQAINRTVKK
jgi:methyltransferase-like protein